LPSFSKKNFVFMLDTDSANLIRAQIKQYFAGRLQVVILMWVCDPAAAINFCVTVRAKRETAPAPGGS
jgi:hypothetical protein